MITKTQSRRMLPVKIENIPEKLKKLDQWVAWKAETNWAGKATKVPKDPKTGKNASATDPATWSSFDQALMYYEQNNDQIDGIGFVFTKSDPFCGIDLDNCRDPQTSLLEPWALEVIKETNSYCEISPSGTGVKIFCEGTLPGPGRKFGNIEMYNSSRYFTVTGMVLEEFSRTIEERSKDILIIYERLNKKSSTLDKTVNSASKIDLASLQVNFGIKKLIREGEQQGDRSEAIMSVLDSLVKARVTEECIFEIFEAYPIGEKYREKGSSRREWLRPQIEKARGFIKPDETSTVFPLHTISGVAGQFAEVYGSVLETPKEFLFIAFLTALGSLLADKVALASELRIQPRLYTLLLGQSADSRKSTALDKVIDFFKGYSKQFEVCHGVGSAEGLQNKLKQTDGGLLLVQDELCQLMEKGNILGSVVIQMINTLYESNTYENQTKNRGIRLDNAYLSILAASTIDSYEKIWTPSLIRMGFPNRILLVPGIAQKRIPIPRKVPEEDKRDLRAMLDKIIENVKRYPELELSSTAHKIYDDWYLRKVNSVHARRLDTIALRLMLLLAANEQKAEVDEDILKKVIDLVNWQLMARKLYDPIDAENSIAKMEQKIRRQLESGPKTDRMLRQMTNADRTGLWVYQTAIKNLEGAREIVSEGKPSKWRLAS